MAGTNVRIGFIGLGLMGRPMAGHLLAKGYPLVVNSRSRGPVDALVAAGAESAGSPSEVARLSDIVIMMLPDTPDVESVLTGPDGVLDGLAKGALVPALASTPESGSRTSWAPRWPSTWTTPPHRPTPAFRSGRVPGYA